MFWQNFKYHLKLILGDRALVFWTLAFPLIMATLFHLAFSQIESSERFQPVRIAVVENAEWQNETIWLQAIEALSAEGEPEQVFETQYLSLEQARDLLVKEEISGYLEIQDGQPEVTVGQNGLDATILKNVVEQIAQEAEITGEIARLHPERLHELLELELPELDDQSRANLSYTMIEYYSLIAMTCLYGGMISMAATNRFLANMSMSGRRVAVSATPKSRLILSGLSASYCVQLVGLGLLFVYTTFGLGVDYGEHFLEVILLSAIGTLTGLALGVLVASSIRATENTKTGIMIMISMLGCFLAGMMGVTMKYVVDRNLPIINLVNPANLITDGFYALHYYGVGTRYWRDIITLVIITAVIICFSVVSLRKEQYDHF